MNPNDANMVKNIEKALNQALAAATNIGCPGGAVAYNNAEGAEPDHFATVSTQTYEKILVLIPDIETAQMMAAVTNDVDRIIARVYNRQ